MMAIRVIVGMLMQDQNNQKMIAELLKSVPEDCIAKYVCDVNHRIFVNRVQQRLKYHAEVILEHILTDYIRSIVAANNIDCNF